MHWIDYVIFGIYFLGILGVGAWFYLKNTDKEEYFVGGRTIGAGHIGLSIVATDVGGGFSIGLGGLGFIMGLSGSWLLFTGLLGAWLAAVVIVPKIKKIDAKAGMLTYPDFLAYKYGKQVAIFAAIISGIGYLAFTGGQILAGAKLAAASVFSEIQGVSSLQFSLYIMAVIIIAYTTLGGIKAVIYTDTVQWIILLIGLIFLGIPFAYFKLGGWQEIRNALPESHFSLTHISWFTLVNWASTIIPIWFIAMTLYQRIYASKNEKEAKKAFFIAGIFEYPVMAFTGVALGMLARVAFPSSDPEMAMPLLLNSVLPVGISGIVLAAYFSAIMSTADSCLIASSGNFVNDILEKYFYKNKSEKSLIRLSQIATLFIGIIALILASAFQSVLEIILHAYSFMVSGLFIPTLFAYFSKKPHPAAAICSMLAGGGSTLFFIFTNSDLPLQLDASIFGIFISAVIYIGISKIKIHVRSDHKNR